MRANPNRGFDHQERRAEQEHPTTIRFGSELAVLAPEPPKGYSTDDINDYLHEVLTAIRDTVHGLGSNGGVLLLPTSEGGAIFVTRTSRVPNTATLAEVLGRVADRHNTNDFVFFWGPAQRSTAPVKAEVEA